MNVPLENIKEVLPYIDEYVIDIKDMNPSIYQRYTGKSNDIVIRNLKWLVSQKKATNVMVRLPLIKGYNDDASREYSKKCLSEIGINKFDPFTYRINYDR